MDHTTLRELITHLRTFPDTKFASVYFESTHDTEDAEKVLELIWRERRSELEEQGATEESLEALEAAIMAGPRQAGKRGRALIVANGRVLVDAELEVPPPQPIARWSPLPYVVPLVAHGIPPVAYVMASVDRIGAEITSVNRNGAVVEHRTVSGAAHPIHEVGGAGGPPRTHQREHARETAKQNLSKTAKEISLLAKDVRAQFVLLSGEVKGRVHLRGMLPEDLRKMTVDINASATRSGLADEAVSTKARKLIDDEQRKRTDAMIDRFRAECGRSAEGLATQGIESTCAVLREANVEVLVIGADGENQTVYAGADPIEVASDSEDLKKFGVSPVGERRADEALPTAAIAVGADLVYVGDDLAITDGFGAILRHR